jgi:hypothetical protein
MVATILGAIVKEMESNSTLSKKDFAINITAVILEKIKNFGKCNNTMLPEKVQKDKKAKNELTDSISSR